MRFVLGALTATAIGLGDEATSQTFAPLEQSIAEGAAEDYLPIRCAALYQALGGWVGKARMGDESFANLTMAIGQLGLLAVASRMHSIKTDSETATSSVMRDTRLIADIYTARFENNYAVEGQAFGNDALVEADIRFCREVTETLFDSN